MSPTTSKKPAALLRSDGGPIFGPARPRRTFEEIINQIKANIEEGRLKRGDKLPTERALAAQFQVSRNTVREALRTLEISGFIILAGRRVAPSWPPAIPPSSTVS